MLSRDGISEFSKDSAQREILSVRVGEQSALIDPEPS